MTAMINSRRLLGLLAILILLFVAGDYFIRFHVILPGFAELEQQEASKDIARCKSAIEREIYHISKIGKDWAEWDDTARFVQDGNADYLESNIQWAGLSSTGIHLVYVINTTGRVVFGEAVDPDTLKPITIRELPVKSFPVDHFLLNIPDNKRYISGVLLTTHGPLLFVSHRILSSKGEGPSPGIILMGRFFGSQILQDLKQQTRVDFTVKNPLTAPFTENETYRVKQLALDKGAIEIVDEGKMFGYDLVKDFQGKPVLLITAALPRSIMEHGRTVARFSSITLLSAAGLIIFAAVVLALVLIIKSERRQEEVEALVEQRTHELRLSEERLHALSDASFEAIFLTEKGVCLEQNHAAEVMFGYSHEEAVGQHANAWIAPEDRDRVIRFILEREEKPYEVKALRKDGSTFPALIQTRAAQYLGRTVRVSAIRDLSEQKQVEREQQIMEDKLRRSQKMEALGLMAGGVAHDLNNILSGIVNYPELILMNLPEDSPLCKPIKAIRESGRNAAAVVDDLLTLARGVASSRENNNLNTILVEYLESPEFVTLQSLHSHVAFRTEPEPNLLNISCSTIHIKKTLMNLVTNAAEAIRERGEIIVATRNQYCEAALPGYPEMQRGEYVILSVADTGTGIPGESLERIFEPFYSRKVAGRSGTGLGLAVAWNAVHDHGGGITVQSSKKGTVFELYFPATRDNLSTIPEVVNLAQFKGAGEKILVVDDDERQRMIALQILDMLNYSGHAVGSGEEALSYLDGETVDLVILDMVMEPGMNGYETYKGILELHPGQKSIITSGFSESREVQQTLALGARRFVKKPYLIGRIAAVIQDTLQNR